MRRSRTADEGGNGRRLNKIRRCACAQCGHGSYGSDDTLRQHGAAADAGSDQQFPATEFETELLVFCGHDSGVTLRRHANF
jgi:hypothetical protein